MNGVPNNNNRLLSAAPSGNGSLPSSSYSLPRPAVVHLDIEYRQQLHALIPSASLSQLSHVLLQLMSQQALAAFAHQTAALFHSFLPFTFQHPTVSPAPASVSDGAEVLADLRPALQPFMRDFLLEAERAFTEAARFAMSEQLDHITAFMEQRRAQLLNQAETAADAHTGWPGADNEQEAEQEESNQLLLPVVQRRKESAATSVHRALSQWLHELVRRADRAQLLVMADAFKQITAPPPAPTQHQALPPASTAAAASATDAKLAASAAAAPPSLPVSSVPVDRPLYLPPVPAISPSLASSPAQQDVLMTGGVETLCLVLSYLSVSELTLRSALVSRRFFSASHDARCWRLLHSLSFPACPPPPLLSLMLHKALQLRHLAFPRSARDEHIAAIAREDAADLHGSSLSPSAYLSHLTSLDLSHCSQLTDAAFAALTSPPPSSSSSPSVPRDSPALAVLSRLQHLKLNGCSALTDAAFLSLFPQLPSLTSLDLSSVGGITGQSLVAVCSHCPQLTAFDLSSCRAASDASVKHVVSSLPSLLSLSLSSCWSLSPLSLQHIGSHCAGLTALDLSGCYAAVTDVSLRFIALGCRMLRRAVLRGCTVTDAGIDILVRGCRRIEVLDLGGDGLAGGGGGRGGAEYTDLVLVSLAKFSHALTSLVLTGCPAVTDRGVLTLAQSCPQLFSLTLTQCAQLTNVSLLQLADSPAAASLSFLSFSLCHRIDDRGLSYLINSCSRLQTLHTAQCLGVTDRTLLFIARRARDAPSAAALRQLDLFRCPITDRGLLGLRKAESAGWEGLHVLLLGNCGRVSDEGVTAMAAMCCRLRELSLYGCSAITDRSMEGLARHCSQQMHIRPTQCLCAVCS